MDERLWLKIKAIMPYRVPELPEEAVPDKYYIGSIDNYNIYIVDGAYVKLKWYEDFTEGSNFMVAGKGNEPHPVLDFIPDNEIWLDGRMTVHELPFILYHELIEVRFMKKSLSYDDAHELANSYETEARIKYLGHHYND